MTFRKLIMLAGVGGLVYAHRKRGGQMTLESFKQSGRDLMEGVKSRADEIRSQAETKLNDVAGKVSGDSGAKDFSAPVSDVSYGTSGYDFNRNR